MPNVPVTADTEPITYTGGNTRTRRPDDEYLRPEVEPAGGDPTPTTEIEPQPGPRATQHGTRTRASTGVDADITTEVMRSIEEPQGVGRDTGHSNTSRRPTTDHAVDSLPRFINRGGPRVREAGRHCGVVFWEVLHDSDSE